MSLIEYQEVDLYQEPPLRLEAVSSCLLQSGISTPGFVLDQRGLKEEIIKFSGLCSEAGILGLYSIKALDQQDVILEFYNSVAGYSVSSLGEARLVRELMGPDAKLHITTPGIRPDQYEEIAAICDVISFNSLTQKSMIDRNATNRKIGVGMRVNPGLSLLDDDRFDPCKKQSKLGVPIDELIAGWSGLSDVDGIHFHTNCDGESLDDLNATLDLLERRIPHILGSVSWLNLGGGYLLPDQLSEPLLSTISEMRERHGLNIYMEPGGSLVRRHGYILTSVIDLFERDGIEVAVLDTSVNHFPEAFEYQYGPDVHGDAVHNEYDYRLVGCTCLAGDDLGIYGFAEKLEVGSKLVIYDVGAYTKVKWHTFNGVELPRVYVINTDQTIRLSRYQPQ